MPDPFDNPQNTKDWKSGNHNLGSVPPYQPEPETSEDTNMDEPPDLMISVVVENGGQRTLALPDSIRKKWADDPVRKADWMAELQAFDSRCLPFQLWVFIGPMY